MTLANSMKSYAARLASFNAAHRIAKKRTSDAKSAKTLKWPHKNPTPPQLACAGFFYRPTSSCPDNTTCYLCQSNLDGWEEDDSPIGEHLKHAPNCGWAITVSIEQAIENGTHNLEDPMSEKMRNARQMTFGSNWPHESKRGWMCKTQKMINAGWHYCPTLESDDFTKCSYCNLSLDGWEPKDDPHDEHQRRSPDCMFFALSTTKPKGDWGKKGRASTASRLSIQSNFTVTTEGVSIVENESNHEESMVSTTDTGKRSGKGRRKVMRAKKVSAKAKGKVLQSKQDESQTQSSFLEPEDDDFAVKVAQVPEPIMNTRKRKSEEISMTNETIAESPTDTQDGELRPPTKKKRATRARSSVAPAQRVPVPASRNEDRMDTYMTGAGDMAPPSVPASKKRGDGRKKRVSSTARKVSTASTASKASLRAAVPNDGDIDAALEAELDRPLTDDEADMEPIEFEQIEGRRLTRSRPGSKQATASVAPTRRGTRASATTIDGPSTVDLYPSIPDSSTHEHEAGAIKPAEDVPADEALETSRPKDTKMKASRKASTRQPSRKQDIEPPLESADVVNEIANHQNAGDEQKAKPQQTRVRQASRQVPARNNITSTISGSQDAMDLASNIDSSVLDTQIVQDDSGHESDASVIKQGRTKSGSRKAPTVSKKAKIGRKGATMSRNIEDIVQPAQGVAQSENAEDQSDVIVTVGAANVEQDIVELMVPKKQSKATKAATNPVKGRKAPSQSKMTTRKASATSSNDELIKVAGDEASQPLSAQSISRPAPSPQSSDAENQPPSSRPSSQRPPLSLQSPSKSQMTRIPLAPATPINSSSQETFSRLQTTFTWSAVDLESIFQGTSAANKENNPCVFGNTTVEARKILTSPETKLTVEQWIHYNAQRGEEKLRDECERLVGKFEGEGLRALKALEGITGAE